MDNVIKSKVWCTVVEIYYMYRLHITFIILSTLENSFLQTITYMCKSHLEIYMIITSKLSFNQTKHSKLKLILILLAGIKKLTKHTHIKKIHSRKIMSFLNLGKATYPFLFRDKLRKS